MAGRHETSWLESRNRNQDTRKIFEQERLTVRVTELVLSEMEQRGFSRAELARELGKSRAYITQVLAGQRNMTLHTLADLAFAAGCRAEVELVELNPRAFRLLDLPDPNIRESARIPGSTEAASQPADGADEPQSPEFAVAA